MDLRRSSEHFGCWVGTLLSGDNHHQLWVPPGFAHGFLVLSETATFSYLCTDYYAPEHERVLLWNDADVGIEWPISGGLDPIISEKDSRGEPLSSAETYP